MQEITLIDSSETDGDDKVQVDYYIFVESFRNLTHAQQRSEKLVNDFNTNIIVLPPTTEGYYRISYGKYSTLEEAKSAIKSIKTNISSKAWIFSVKK
jgi:septal ring-binding cell division protein DamX